MFKSLLKITILLVFVFSTGSLQTEAIAENNNSSGNTEVTTPGGEVAGTTQASTKAGDAENKAASEANGETTEKAGRIYSVPDNGVTIVLRAPTSANYQLVKQSKGILGKTESETIQGLKVSLPENTPVRFIVDQVNTLLYDVRITVDEGGQQLKATSDEKPDKFPIDKALACIASAQKVIQCSSEADKCEAQKPLLTLKNSVEIIKNLHIELNTILYQTEGPLFYSNPVDNFAKIKTDAKEKTKELLGAKISNAQHIRHHAADTIRTVREAYANKIPEVLTHLPTNASDPIHSIAVVFEQIAAKLDMIEKTEWFQKGTRDRLLIDRIKYTCVFIPKEANARLKAIPPFVVTVIRKVGLQDIKVTVGPFMSDLRDENYVVRENKIVQGRMDRWSKQLGFLVHLPVYSNDFRRFRYAFALSAGLPTQVGIANDTITFGPGPATIGVSLLFAGPSSDSLISLTGGVMVKSVKRIKGYSVGDPYGPGKSLDDLTKKVNRLGVFGAITFSYDVFNLLNVKVVESVKGVGTTQ